MFTVGRNGTEKCFDDGKCKCWCEIAANNDGTCREVDHEDYDLYEFNDASNLNFDRPADVKCK